MWPRNKYPHPVYFGRTEMSGIIKRVLTLAAIVLFTNGCATLTPEQLEDIEGFCEYKQGTLDEVGIFELERQVDILERLNELSFCFRGSPVYSVLIVTKTEGSGSFFNIVPNFKLVDRDMDGKADQFAYFSNNEKNTQEFGWIFDLNRDGKIDYMVYNGGLAPSEDSSITIYSYHFIDSNYDGKFDIYVCNNNIDLDRNELVEEGISAWVYDKNFDGTIDKAEYLGGKNPIPVEVSKGVVSLKTFYISKKGQYSEQAIGKDFNLLANQQLEEINSYPQFF